MLRQTDEVRLRRALLSAIRKAETILPEDVVAALEEAMQEEDSKLARAQLAAILENIRIARTDSIPLCQDTGIQTFFVQAGVRSPYLELLNLVIAQAVAEATATVPLRPNTVHPFTNKNPGDNLGRGMPVIDYELIESDKIIITLLPKGGGSENCCALKMVTPSAGISGIKRAILDHVIKCKGTPCPPTIVGVGIGGGADVAMKLAKRAVLREIAICHPEQPVAKLEEELLELINKSGVGPMGLGGNTTSLAVHIEYAFRHPASLPLGLVLQCWANRRAQVQVNKDGSIKVS
jgi:fumarate hydratase subunit alpha